MNNFFEIHHSVLSQLGTKGADASVEFHCTQHWTSYSKLYNSCTVTIHHSTNTATADASIQVFCTAMKSAATSCNTALFAE